MVWTVPELVCLKLHWFLIGEEQTGLGCSISLGKEHFFPKQKANCASFHSAK
jgi:hypothetical protein